MGDHERSSDQVTESYEIRQPFEPTKIAGGRSEDRWYWISELEPGDELRAYREPWNRHDDNAVALHDAGGRKLGYLTKTFAARLAPVFDRDISGGSVRILVNGAPRDRTANLLICTYPADRADVWDALVGDLRAAMMKSGAAEVVCDMYGWTVSVPSHRVLNARLTKMRRAVMGLTLELRAQLCPACGTKTYSGWYPGRLCDACVKRTTSLDGRAVEFHWTDGLGFAMAGRFVDTWEPYDSQECFVDGVRCVANTARWGGIVVQAVAEGVEPIVRAAGAIEDDPQGAAYFADFDVPGMPDSATCLIRFVGHDTPEVFNAVSGRWSPNPSLLTIFADGGRLERVDAAMADDIAAWLSQSGAPKPETRPFRDWLDGASGWLVEQRWIVDPESGRKQVETRAIDPLTGHSAISVGSPGRQPDVEWMIEDYLTSRQMRAQDEHEQRTYLQTLFPELAGGADVPSGPLGAIRLRFAKAFAQWGGRLDDEDVAARCGGNLECGPWAVEYQFGRDDDGEYLEYYGINGEGADSHELIREDGTVEALPACREITGLSGDSTRKAEAKRAALDWNCAVVEELRVKRLWAGQGPIR